MTKKVKRSNQLSLNYENPYYVPIEDGDEETIQFYKTNGVPIAYIALPGRMKHYYAIFNADTAEEALMMRRFYDNCEKREVRIKEKEKDNVSYDALLEAGYQASDYLANNPEELFAYKTVICTLAKVLDGLAEEKLELCKAIARGDSQREAAEKLGMSRRTYRDKKDKVLDEIFRELKKYK